MYAQHHATRQDACTAALKYADLCVKAGGASYDTVQRVADILTTELGAFEPEMRFQALAVRTVRFLAKQTDVLPVEYAA